MQGVKTLEKENICPANPNWNTRFKRYAFADSLNGDLCNAFRDAEGLLMQSELIKNSRSTTAGIFDFDGKKYFIKRSNVNSLFERLRRIGRMPRSTRNMLAAAKLSEINILTPKVYMSLETGHFLLPGASYLITEAFEQPLTVGGNMAALHERFNGTENFAKTICSMVIKMHCCGMTHGDLKMNNILTLKTADGNFRFGLFDLDGMLWHGSSCPEDMIISEVARMASSYCLLGRYCNMFDESKFAEYLRIWSKAYAAAGGKDYTDNRIYWRRIAKFMPGYNIQELQQ